MKKNSAENLKQLVFCVKMKWGQEDKKQNDLLERSLPSAYHSSQNKKARRFVHKQSSEAWRDLLLTILSWKQDDVNTDVDRYA